MGHDDLCISRPIFTPVALAVLEQLYKRVRALFDINQSAECIENNP
ncbi:Unknown protein sequence [Pseudomonas amygdali pv. lachrymans]|nr:Unknown protein sequence [Pseudomonas amygdali pv. lachrymans]